MSDNEIIDEAARLDMFDIVLSDADIDDIMRAAAEHDGLNFGDGSD